jgi:effector-binding domain-containing protein
MTTTSEIRIDERPEQPYLGIRTQTPMKGMFAVVTKLFKELNTWGAQRQLAPAGPPFLRYHVIDMQGEMDIEVGWPVTAPQAGDERVRPAVLPAGRFASLVYVGNGYAGNKALIEWAKTNAIAWDRWDDPKGDAFRCRYEAYLTDPKVEPRKKMWQVEVAIKLA